MTEEQPIKIDGRVNPAMLTLARESRGISQDELAETILVSQAKVSKYESGILEVSTVDLVKIAKILEYPEEFFFQTDEVCGFGSICLYHRKRRSLPVRELRVIHATINVIRLHFSRLLAGAEVEVRNEFPRLDIDKYDGCPGTVARLVRANWNLPLGPIRNLVKEIEGAGGIVCQCDFGTPKLDAVSHWPRLMPPMFFINQEIPVDRWRFTLAHELGHLVMHRRPTPNQEEEADSFASEFLMPEREISADLESISIAKAAQLKPYWRVSMQALIRRAFELKKITQNRYKSLCVQISRLGHRKEEPAPLSPEEPTVLQDVIRMHQDHYGYNVQQLSYVARSCETHFRRLFLSGGKPRFRVVG